MRTREKVRNEYTDYECTALSTGGFGFFLGLFCGFGAAFMGSHGDARGAVVLGTMSGVALLGGGITVCVAGRKACKLKDELEELDTMYDSGYDIPLEDLERGEGAEIAPVAVAQAPTATREYVNAERKSEENSSSVELEEIEVRVPAALAVLTSSGQSGYIRQ